MQDFSFYKKWLVCVAVIIQVLFAGCGSLNSSLEEDCGYEVAIYNNEDERNFDVVISLVIAEIIDDKINCGFGYIAVKVNDLQIAESQLIEEIVRDGKPAYRFKGDFDPQRIGIHFTADNKGYIATAESLESKESNVTQSSAYHYTARKFPPK